GRDRAQLILQPTLQRLPERRAGDHGDDDEDERHEPDDGGHQPRLQGVRSVHPLLDHCGALIMYPTPRTVCSRGVRPASIFLRRYEIYSSTTDDLPPKS